MNFKGNNLRNQKQEAYFPFLIGRRAVEVANDAYATCVSL